MKIEDFQPVQSTPYSFKYKFKVYTWKLVNKTIFRLIPNQIKEPRIIMLNLFGANIDKSCFIHRNSNIEFPWNLTMGVLSSLGENAKVRCADKVIIGDKCTIGRECSLLSGSHDISSSNFVQIAKPIIIEDGAWLTTGVYLLPGVTIARFSVISVGSVVVKNTTPFDIVGGNPAKFIKKRVFSD